MNFDQCEKCGKVVLPNASEAMRGQVCVCALATCAPAFKIVEFQSLESGPRKTKPHPDLEQMFLNLLAEHAPDLPKPLPQQELIPGRKFTTDFSWRDEMVAVEIEGLVHRTRSSFFSDCEKHTMLAVAGWRVLRFNGRMLRGQIGNVVDWLRAALGKGSGG